MIAVPTFLYGSEIWTLCSKDLSRIQAAEMMFLRPVKDCTILNKVKNEDICKKVKIFCVKDKIQEYRPDWLDHFRHMPRSRLPRAALYYNSRGKRDQGSCRKRWLDREAGSGLWPNPWRRWWWWWIMLKLRFSNYDFNRTL